jgi:hypothetical protein
MSKSNKKLSKLLTGQLGNAMNVAKKADPAKVEAVKGAAKEYTRAIQSGKGVERAKIKYQTAGSIADISARANSDRNTNFTGRASVAKRSKF